MTITVIGKTKDSAKRDWAKIKHKYHMSLSDTIQFLSNNVNTVEGKNFFNHTLVLTEGFQDNPVYEAIGSTAKTQVALVIDESRANKVQSVAAAEPTNEKIYAEAYRRLTNAVEDFLQNSQPCTCELTETAYNDLASVHARIDADVVETFNFGDKHTGYNFTNKLEYDGMRVTVREKLNTLNELIWRWVEEDKHGGKLTEQEAKERRRKVMLVNDKHERPEEPQQEEVNKDYGKPLSFSVQGVLSPEVKEQIIREIKAVYGDDRRVMLYDDTIKPLEEAEAIEYKPTNEPFLTITLEDINAVPQVWLEGKEVKNKQAVLFEYVTDDVEHDIPSYLFIQTLDSGEDKKRANVVKREYNQPIRTTGDKLTGADFF